MERVKEMLKGVWQFVVICSGLSGDGIRKDAVKLEVNGCQGTGHWYQKSKLVRSSHFNNSINIRKYSS